MFDVWYISIEQIEDAAKAGEGGDASDAVAGAGQVVILFTYVMHCISYVNNLLQKNLAEKQHKSKVAALNKQIENQTAYVFVRIVNYSNIVK